MPKTKTVQQRAAKVANKLGAFIDHHHTDLTAAELLVLGQAVDILTKREQEAPSPVRGFCTCYTGDGPDYPAVDCGIPAHRMTALSKRQSR